MKSQKAVGDTFLDDLKSVEGNCDRLNNREKVTRQCKDSSTTAFTVSFSALLAEWENYKYCFEAVIIESKSKAALVTAAKMLREKLDNREKADAASKNCS